MNYQQVTEIMEDNPGLIWTCGNGTWIHVKYEDGAYWYLTPPNAKGFWSTKIDSTILNLAKASVDWSYVGNVDKSGSMFVELAERDQELPTYVQIGKKIFGVILRMDFASLMPLPPNNSIHNQFSISLEALENFDAKWLIAKQPPMTKAQSKTQFPTKEELFEQELLKRHREIDDVHEQGIVESGLKIPIMKDDGKNLFAQALAQVNTKLDDGPVW